MSLSKDFDDFIKEFEDIKDASLLDLQSELIDRTPVGDTAMLKGAWTLEPVNGGGWLLINNMEYADFILNGRRVVNGKQLGSLQLPDGVSPILQRYNENLEDKLARIKR
jgi:hypothetical protein